MASDLSIRGSGTSFAIMAGGRVIAGPYTGHGNAIAALRGVEARLAPVLARACMACATSFKTKSRGQRLCPTCRSNA